MFNCHDKLNLFYDECVRLRDKRKVLIEYRDKNVERVREGTRVLRKENPDGSFPMFVDQFSQGSMAMHTVNEAQNNDDQDIDHALIYDADDAIENPADMRKFVLNAVKATSGNFKTEPEAQTNAVTIWYEENYHVDLALYKRKTDLFGFETYYHAGETWEKRDPKAINEWFTKKKDELSPQDSLFTKVTVKPDQVRRVVRLFKFWANSRSDWSMPSGLILSALAIEKFVPHNTRDDISFVSTLKAVRNRLMSNRDVRNPTDLALSLTSSEKSEKQILALLEKLDKWLNELEATLIQTSCAEEVAQKAWSKFFRNDWWGSDLKKTENALDSQVGSKLKVDVTFGNLNGGRKQPYFPASRQTIPVRQKIQFRLAPVTPAPEKIEWTVQNRGDEAGWAKQLDPRKGYYEESNPTVCNEQSAYRGDHVMICRVTAGGRTSEIKIPVRIRR